MGVGGPKPKLPEIAETRAAGREEAFEAIIQRVKDSDGTIEKDETAPLYTEVGMEEFEVGHRRVVEFTLNRTEFQLVRNLETHALQGAGHQKHIEIIESPKINIILKKRNGYGGEWQVVDLEDMF